MGNRLNKIIKHIEQTEGMKFQKKPTFAYTNKIGAGHNIVKRSVSDGRVKVSSAKVQVNRKFAQGYQQPFVDATVAHELRENLYHQHGIDRKKDAPNVHNKAQRWINKDERWAKKAF
jgi:predicted SprT family Zn-dependent metalloprotease